ncbi:hypothetical protein [Lacipirellula parvula]|uniref:Uncharacterized protein n=1 Tax=Lacipirellula parvula TaxID=2650471 RepID=A0A5K7XC75_9BACT|nr:hypothetical protein [Lacipirellula parvula]BBO31946.1 hypothetical protein PLANPX_1558 [Lacipirellula parvula]
MLADSVVANLSRRLISEFLAASTYSCAERLMLHAAHREGRSPLDNHGSAGFAFSYFSRLGWPLDRIEAMSFCDATAILDRDGWESPSAAPFCLFELECQCNFLSDLVEREGCSSTSIQEGILRCQFLISKATGALASEASSSLLAALRDLENVGAQSLNLAGDEQAGRVARLVRIIRGPLVKDSPTCTRDAWIYEQAMKSIPWKTILSGLKRIGDERGWDEIESQNGIKSAANRYADKNNFPRPPSRTPGRKKSEQL